MAKAFCTFNVLPRLPRKLYPLREIAFNLWWTWQQQCIGLFRRLDPRLWEESGHNPVKMLNRIGQEELERVAADASFIAHQERVYRELQDYLRGPTWFQAAHPDLGGHRIAYFSMEFGLTECLPIYSGGLGILAGDHLKSASELGLPLVGVGLLYQYGYCRQYLNCDGWQQELSPRTDFHDLPIVQVTGRDGAPLRISLDFPGRQVLCQVWRVQVGRVPLFLLDCNVPDNDPRDRLITQQLYGGDQETRIQQELVLGIGGMRALIAIGIDPDVCHMNEGHAAFAALERIRHRRVASGVAAETARQVVSGGTVFTTHTPVPAGIDQFPPNLLETYLKPYYEEAGFAKEEFLSLGRRVRKDDSEPFNMALLALRTASFANGVSRLHGEVSRRMWQDLWPKLPVGEVPIGHITNGIHTRSWISYEMEELLLRYLGPDWLRNPADQSVWENVSSIPDEELWRTHERRRERLVAFTRSRLVAQLKEKGAPRHEIKAAEGVLDPKALTIGFARRFATYKRATLILRDGARLKRLLTNRERPVQIIFAGKAHPRDAGGKELIKEIFHFMRDDEVRRHVVFLENYDINVARYMVEGVDVWLNTPRRPHEASGTSGMKVLPNGGLNLSVLDGWWEEAFDPSVGWAIGNGEDYEDSEAQDQIEASALYELLEKDVVPLFYRRDSGNLPREWIEKMKRSMRLLCPVFNTNRMVQEYAEKYYIPSLRNWRRLSADNLKGARELTEWQRHVREHWGEVSVVEVAVHQHAVAVGEELWVEARVALGALAPCDVKVQAYVGELADDQGITNGRGFELRRVGGGLDCEHRYAGTIPCLASGRFGLSVRVLPYHESLPNPLNFKHICWVSPESTRLSFVEAKARTGAAAMDVENRVGGEEAAAHNGASDLQAAL